MKTVFKTAPRPAHELFARRHVSFIGGSFVGFLAIACFALTAPAATIADKLPADASVDTLKKEALDRITARLATEGLPGYIEAVDGDTVHFLAFSSHWFQANQWKPGQSVSLRASKPTPAPTSDAIEAELLTRKNLGTYGSGASEATLRLKNAADAKKLSGWMKGQVVRVIAQ